MKKIPVIIDCDPGIDDTIALFMAFASEKLDIRAVTPVSGNQTIEKIASNALNIVDFLGGQAKVALGAPRPLMREVFTAEFVHGATGVGNTEFPKATINFHEKNAFDTIYEEAIKCNGELRIVAVGPLTNIATTLLHHPEVKDMIYSITIMGGAIYGGNDTPAAEFNIYVDPEAAKIVFESGIPITMVGLDATHKAFVLKEEIEEIGTYNSKSKVAAELMSYMLPFYKKCGFEGTVMHDPCALAYVIDPTLLKTKKYFVSVETKGEFTSGKTVVDIYGVTGKEPNVDVATDVDRDRFVELMKELMKKYN